MEYNLKLVDLIEKRTKNTLIDPRETYGMLWKKWPQINPHTRLSNAQNRTFNLVRNRQTKWKERWNNRSGRKARLWRGLGEIFNKRLWIQKGQEYGPDPLSDPIDYDTVQLERFGITTQYGETAIIDAYYDSFTDTLWIG